MNEDENADGPDEAAGASLLTPAPQTATTSVATGTISPAPETSPREETAKVIAYALLGIFGATIMLLLTYGAVSSEAGALEFAQILIPVQSTLIASVVGYYFGTQRSS